MAFVYGGKPHPTGSVLVKGLMESAAMTSRDDFEQWLMSIDDSIEELRQQIGKPLDYSPESLDVVEQWILKKYESTESMLSESESENVNLLASYVGETFRKAINGVWDIRLDDAKYAFFGMPIIRKRDGKSDAECPLTLVTASANRRTGNYLRILFDNWTE